MKFLLIIAFVLSSAWASAQSNTTQALQKLHEGSMSLYFYKNTLRMLNQSENKEFDELIRNIEKMKFLMVDKEKEHFGKPEYQQLRADYQKEYYEPIVTARYEGRNMDVFFKDKKGSTPGTVVLVNDSTSLMVLDIIGTIDVSKAGALFSVIDQSTDVGGKIKDFMNHKGKKEGEKNEGKVDH
jgi:hypothetical protein